MIVTVTPNPAYDATYEVPEVRLGEVQRVSTARLRPGGKGINVAAVLAQLGERVTATGFASPAFAEEVASCGVGTAFVTTLPHVRRTLVVAEPGRTTGLWEPGVPVTPGSAEALLRRVGDLLPTASCLVVSGSLPPGVDDTLPAELATSALAAGVPTVIDTSGPALLTAAGVPGVVLMPNDVELAELVGPCPHPTDTARRSAALVAAGARAVVATRGAEGLVVTDRSGSWHARPPYAVAGNATGAGDAAAAAVARGLAHGVAPAALAAEAVAASAAAVASPVAGAIDLELHRDLLPRVEVRTCTPGLSTGGS
ncbi:1-phosphofructokinase family hexose kinase [Nocardioides coralli]|uniref:1-phosphofructokinase family hexose kinase n=1 Tax=Nocardioides coralli TaxID=2872154 RepID=UPI001CA3DF7F|nr:hexose kinase [Nocardioides coralli]QZY28591.1 hexose kinase [Nocardioides coralli]